MVDIIPLMKRNRYGMRMQIKWLTVGAVGLIIAMTGWSCRTDAAKIKYGLVDRFPSVPDFPARDGAFVSIPPTYLLAMRARAQDELRQAKLYPFSQISRGSKSRKVMALTFDDGPHQFYTLRLLQVLKQTHTPATFFLVGKQVAKFPTLVQAEIVDGHEVGNHTYDHLNLAKIRPSRIDYELDHCDQIIDSLVGALPRFFRPPGGQYTPAVLAAISKRHYVTALWSCDPGDFTIPGADLVLERSVDHISPGTIFLFHDGMPETISILPTLIAEARRRGYTFVTLGDLASTTHESPFADRRPIKR